MLVPVFDKICVTYPSPGSLTAGHSIGVTTKTHQGHERTRQYTRSSTTRRGNCTWEVSSMDCRLEVSLGRAESLLLDADVLASDGTRGIGLYGR